MVFYVSHRLDEILSLSDRITVLQDGRVIGELDPKVTTKPEMINMMAGRVVQGAHAPRPYVERADVVLRAQNLSTKASRFTFALHGEQDADH